MTRLQTQHNGSAADLTETQISNIRVDLGIIDPDTLALTNILTDPNIVRGSAEAYMTTPDVFNSYYNLKHSQEPFSGGQGHTSEQSTDNSPLGLRYYRYTNTTGDFAYTLHLASDSTDFNPVAQKWYQIFLLVRGVASSVGKTLNIGVFRGVGDRVDSDVILKSTWSFVRSERAQHSTSTFNLYVHSSGNEGSNLIADEQFDVAAYYVKQFDSQTQL